MEVKQGAAFRVVATATQPARDAPRALRGERGGRLLDLERFQRPHRSAIGDLAARLDLQLAQRLAAQVELVGHEVERRDFLRAAGQGLGQRAFFLRVGDAHARQTHGQLAEGHGGALRVPACRAGNLA